MPYCSTAFATCQSEWDPKYVGSASKAGLSRSSSVMAPPEDDLVIGADGIRSAVRLAFGDGATARPVGQVDGVSLLPAHPRSHPGR